MENGKGGIEDTSHEGDTNKASLIIGLSTPQSQGEFCATVALNRPWEAQDYQRVHENRLDGTLLYNFSPPFVIPADACHQLKLARQDRYDFITTTLPQSPTNETRSDLLYLDAQWWRTSVVGQVVSEAPWDVQLAWAWHVNLPAVILPPLPTSTTNDTTTGNKGNSSLDSYARLVLQHAMIAKSQGTSQLWVPVTLEANAIQDWLRLYQLCHHATNVGVLLQFPPTNSQPEPTDSVAKTAQILASQLQLLHLAISQPIKALCVSTGHFLTNKRGYPTLSKLHQTLWMHILQRIGRTLRVLVQGPSSHALAGQPAAHRGVTSCLPYLQYLQHLRQRDAVTAILDSHEATLERDYLDQLQRPLQPLKDHLENVTYETFEKDPVKYARYQQALSLAYQDRANTPFCVVLVVGAGRGPLVTCALAAYEELDVSRRPQALRVFAVEKNPSAMVYLQAKAAHDQTWKQYGVSLVHIDLRQLAVELIGGTPGDIVVSELLGSFGCNELSPECLDALFTTTAVHDRTVSIPTRYISHLAPVSSAKLHSQARVQALYPNEDESGVLGLQTAMETPYVVRTHAASQTHREQDCWEFVHPSVSSGDKNRTAMVEFTPDAVQGCGTGSGTGAFEEEVALLAQQWNVPQGYVLHGLLGTFTADLYYSARLDKLVQISTAPSNFSVGMFSWFPLYFPIANPLYVPANANVTAYVRRQWDVVTSRVWYEWSVTVHDQNGDVLGISPLHNINGRSYHVSM